MGYMGWLVNATPRRLYLRKRDPIPIVRDVGWKRGPVWTGAEDLATLGIRLPDLAARVESLYRLNYPAHVITYTKLIYFERF
jgi:hypothetical protein